MKLATLLLLTPLFSCGAPGAESSEVVDASAGPAARERSGKTRFFEVRGTSADGSSSTGLASKDPVSFMRAAMAELEARSEHGAARVEIQHLFICSWGESGRGGGRTSQEAEELAAQLYGELVRDADFNAAIEKRSDGARPAIYRLEASARPATDEVPELVSSLGRVAWRLEVGEYGVLHSARGESSLGWHIIKRLE